VGVDLAEGSGDFFFVGVGADTIAARAEAVPGLGFGLGVDFLSSDFLAAGEVPF